MTTPISDEEIEELERLLVTMRELHGRRSATAYLAIGEKVIAAVPSCIARIRSDAATIARQSVELAALRVVAEAARKVFDEVDACRGECSIRTKYGLETALSALDAATKAGT